VSAIVYGLHASEYHARIEVNKSLLDLVAIAPVKAWSYLGGEKPSQTASKMLGTHVHAAVLEPDKLMPYPPVNKRTKEGKAEIERLNEEYKGTNVIFCEPDVYYMQVQAIAESVRNHPRARVLLSQGQPEVSVFSKLNGTLVKCRPDWLRDDGIIVDLKTTQDASPAEFARSAWKYRYHVQAAFYTDVCLSAGIAVRSFVFVAVETKPPYLVACYVLNPLDLELGREAYRRDLDTYQRCVYTGEWPGYSEDIKTLELPAWARAQSTIQGEW
jgi:exodeoxyribonuclease VIII